jgi:ribosomal protein S18 acetylase RimI-like enzyme
VIDTRHARPEEYDEAGRVTALAYREFVRPGETSWASYVEQIADVRSRAEIADVIVAVEDGRIVGSATLELGDRIDADEDPPLAPDEAHIRMLGVHPDARGRGVARALMQACFAAALNAGRSRITLHTTQRMRTAQAMYKAMGFTRLEDRVFPDGFVLLSYELPIATGDAATRRSAADAGGSGG